MNVRIKNTVWNIAENGNCYCDRSYYNIFTRKQRGEHVSEEVIETLHKLFRTKVTK